jgi:hypothetical protein
MQSIINLSAKKHKTLFRGKTKKYEIPTTPYIRGNAMLEESPVKVEYFGSIPKIIHQTWKNENLPSQWREYFDGWYYKHPDFVHILWDDDDNLHLVEQHYPEFLDAYNWLPLMIQKTDFVRLMYLHKYGGIYADLDYECFENILSHLPQEQGVMLVESPLSLTEITQNSFMIAEAGHTFIYNVLQLIEEIVSDVREKHSIKYPFTKLYNNVFFGSFLHTLSTLFMTGPATLDKAFVRAYLKDDMKDEMKHESSKPPKVRLLPHAQFYDGAVAKHHHNGTWFDGYNLLQLFIIVITLVLLATLTAGILITYFSTRSAYSKKYKVV